MRTLCADLRVQRELTRRENLWGHSSGFPDSRLARSCFPTSGLSPATRSGLSSHTAHSAGVRALPRPPTWVPRQPTVPYPSAADPGNHRLEHPSSPFSGPSPATWCRPRVPAMAHVSRAAFPSQSWTSWVEVRPADWLEIKVETERLALGDPP